MKCVFIIYQKFRYFRVKMTIMNFIINIYDSLIKFLLLILPQTLKYRDLPIKDV